MEPERRSVGLVDAPRHRSSASSSAAPLARRRRPDAARRPPRAAARRAPRPPSRSTAASSPARRHHPQGPRQSHCQHQTAATTRALRCAPSASAGSRACVSTNPKVRGFNPLQHAPPTTCDNVEVLPNPAAALHSGSRCARPTLHPLAGPAQWWSVSPPCRIEPARPTCRGPGRPLDSAHRLTQTRPAARRAPLGAARRRGRGPRRNDGAGAQENRDTGPQTVILPRRSWSRPPGGALGTPIRRSLARGTRSRTPGPVGGAPPLWDRRRWEQLEAEWTPSIDGRKPSEAYSSSEPRSSWPRPAPCCRARRGFGRIAHPVTTRGLPCCCQRNKAWRCSVEGATCPV